MERCSGRVHKVDTRELTYREITKRRESAGGDSSGASENVSPVSRIQAFFYQSCWVCGRSLRTPVRSLGERVACGHCGNAFIASDPAVSEATSRTPDNLQRAEELLARLDKERNSSRHGADDRPATDAEAPQSHLARSLSRSIYRSLDEFR